MIQQGVLAPKLIVPGPWLPTRYCAENLWSEFEKAERRFFDRLFKEKRLKDKFNIVAMAGSLAFYSSKKLQDIILGATAYTAVGNHFLHLYTAAIDDTFNGGTAGKATYGSYAVLQLANNTTIFAAGTGTTTYTKTFPSDAAKTWATSTSGTNTITYLGDLDANAGSAADNGILWCSVTSVTINSGDTPQLAQNAISVVQD